MNRLISFILAALAVSVGGGPTSALAHGAPPADPILSQAEQARIRLDLTRERELLHRLADSDAAADARSVAWRRLATFSWRFDAQPEEARGCLDRAEALGSGRRDALLERARMERTLGNFAAALNAAREALGLTRNPNEERVALTSLTLALTAQSFAARQTMAAADAPRDDQAVLLRETAARLGERIRAEPGLLQPSRAWLDAALVLDDGAAALAAWRSYFRLGEEAPRDGLLSQPAQTLASQLAGWDGRQVSDDRREAVVLALAASGLFEEAEFVALASGSPDATAFRARPRIADVIVWSTLIRQVRPMIDEHYRELAIGKGDADAFRSYLVELGTRVWAGLSWPGAPPPFSVDAFDEEISRRFNAVFNAGMTGGDFDVHFGHRVVDDRRTIGQYGHTASVRFVVLDGMVSNGYQTWVWDGRAQHGGWGGASEIVQVRSAYADGPMQAWSEVSDPKRRAELDEQIARESAEDHVRAASDPYAYLEGLALRMRTGANMRILQALQKRGLEGPALRTAFIAEFERASIESSIFAHEGRHAIDSADPADALRSGAEREYRAKLSEVAFAPDPFMALPMGIISADIGNDTPHGMANLRLMQRLIGWMSTHAAEIKGLDDQRPLLPQLDLLTADQIRAAVRILDPLAGEGEEDTPS